MFCEKCGYKNKDNAKFCKNCGTNLENDNLINEDDKAILENEFNEVEDEKKLSKKDLLDYLSIAKELEINKLGLKNSINDLHRLDKKKYSEIVRPTKKNDKPIFNIFKKYIFETPLMLSYGLAIPIYIIVMFTYHKLYDQLYSRYFEWDTPELFTAIPITLVICIVIFIVVLILLFVIHNTVGRFRYNNKLNKYNKVNNEIDKNNDLQLKEYNAQKSIIIDRVNDVNVDLEDVEKTLNKFYNLDVIYPKYRNLIAVTTFIEYLESGRCKSLYGYTGCYNVYEQELRQNVIIGKLDQVLVKLDQIKKAQYATFLAIQESNAIQNSIVSTCNNMLNESTKANASLEAQAQDTKILNRKIVKLYQQFLH